jgi:hypothetical protein
MTPKTNIKHIHTIKKEPNPRRGLAAVFLALFGVFPFFLFEERDFFDDIWPPLLLHRTANAASL